jgi:hypothetical protein
MSCFTDRWAALQKAWYSCFTDRWAALQRSWGVQALFVLNEEAMCEVPPTVPFFGIYACSKGDAVTALVSLQRNPQIQIVRTHDAWWTFLKTYFRTADAAMVPLGVRSVMAKGAYSPDWGSNSNYEQMRIDLGFAVDEFQRNQLLNTNLSNFLRDRRPLASSMAVEPFKVTATWHNREKGRLAIKLLEGKVVCKKFFTKAFQTPLNLALAVQKLLVLDEDLPGWTDHAKRHAVATEESPLNAPRRDLFALKVKFIISSMDPDNVSAKKRRVENARGCLGIFRGMGDKEAEFWEKGHVLLPRRLDRSLCERLLKYHELHFEQLKAAGFFGRVHGARGAISSTLALEGTDTTHISDVITDKENEGMFVELADAAASQVGIAPAGKIRNFAMVLFEEDQRDQTWHQDGPSPLLAFIVTLLPGSEATQFLKYRGSDTSKCTSKTKQQANIAAWLNIPRSARTSATAIESKGALDQGSIVAFNTAHIHRAPPRHENDKTPRRAIVFACEGDPKRHAHAHSRPIRCLADANDPGRYPPSGRHRAQAQKKQKQATALI